MSRSELASWKFCSSWGVVTIYAVNTHRLKTVVLSHTEENVDLVNDLVLSQDAMAVKMSAARVRAETKHKLGRNSDIEQLKITDDCVCFIVCSVWLYVLPQYFVSMSVSLYLRLSYLLSVMLNP